MSKRGIITTTTFFGFFVLLLSQPRGFVNASDPCLTGGHCCTKTHDDCTAIGLSSYHTGDDACVNSWGDPLGSVVGKVCCVGTMDNTDVYGRCASDYGPVIAQTQDDTPPATAATTRQLPRLSSLIKLGRNQFIGNIIKSLLGFAGTLTVIMMVYGGLLWMTAAGNDKAVTQAKKIIFWTAVGLVLIFSSYAILKFLFDSLMPAA